LQSQYIVKPKGWKPAHSDGPVSAGRPMRRIMPSIAGRQRSAIERTERRRSTSMMTFEKF